MTRTRLLAGAGTLALVVAAIIVFVPGILPVPRARLASLMDGISGVAGLGALALLSGAIAVVQGLWSSETPQTPPALTALHTTETDENDDEPLGPVVGEAFDEQLASTERVGKRTAQGEAVIREELRKLAVDVYQEAHNCDWETAARAVEEGRWTDSQAAAAFLGGPDAPSLPLRVWFRDVLSDSGAFYNQALRTIRAIYSLEAEAAPGTESLPEEVADIERALEIEQADAADDSWTGGDADTAGSVEQSDREGAD